MAADDDNDKEIDMNNDSISRYHDSHLTVEDGTLTVNGYYFWFASQKKVPLDSIEEVTRHPMDSCHSGKLRFWGTSNFKYWFPRDPQRHRKKYLFVFAIKKRWIHPVLTPDNPQAFSRTL